MSPGSQLIFVCCEVGNGDGELFVFVVEEKEKREGGKLRKS